MNNTALLAPVALFVLLVLTSCGSEIVPVKPVIDMRPVAEAIEFLSKCAVLITLLIGGFKMLGRKS